MRHLTDEPMTDMERAFWRYHEMNPHVYDLFVRYANQVVRVKEHYSARAIFDRIRWFTEVETRGSEFKISNNHSPYYARMFMQDYPATKGFFILHALGVTGLNQPELPGRAKTYAEQW